MTKKKLVESSRALPYISIPNLLYDTIRLFNVPAEIFTIPQFLDVPWWQREREKERERQNSDRLFIAP